MAEVVIEIDSNRFHGHDCGSMVDPMVATDPIGIVLDGKDPRLQKAADLQNHLVEVALRHHSNGPHQLSSCPTNASLAPLIQSRS
jgi:hypothetical protein